MSRSFHRRASEPAGLQGHRGLLFGVGDVAAPAMAVVAGFQGLAAVGAPVGQLGRHPGIVKDAVHAAELSLAVIAKLACS